MVQKRITLTACDICGEEGATSYVIAEEAERSYQGKGVDLCETHATPLKELSAHGRKATITVNSARSRRRTSPHRAPSNPTRIYSEEELNALEKEGGK